MTHNPFTLFIQAHGVVILDGAMATELERRGADIADPLWSAKVLLEAPELIRQVHYDYFGGRRDVAITASYQASFAGFAARASRVTRRPRFMRLQCDAGVTRDAFWADLGQSPGAPVRWWLRRWGRTARSWPTAPNTGATTG
ncbi:MAG: homocysteine S-methyltransferase family protein [Caldilineaceae bacterium]